MGTWIRVLFAILVLLVEGNVSDEEVISQACSTLNEAKTMNEEIAKLFNSVSIKEITEPLYRLYGSAKFSHPIDKCYKSRYDNFSNKFYFNLGAMRNSASRNEFLLATAQSLKKNMTEIAYTFKEAWMKIRKIYRLTEGIFDGLDEFFKDSLMKKSASLGVEAKKDKNADPNIIQKIIDELSGEFEDANALMKMMPRQILNAPLALQNNLIYSQVHSALATTKHEPLLSKNSAIAEHIKVFTEISIIIHLKKATNNLFDTYLTGYEDSKRFSNMTKDTAERIDKALEGADEMSVETPCAKGKETAAQLVDETSKLLRSVRNEQETLVEDFYRHIRFWFDSKINSFDFLDKVRQALTLVSSIVPQNVHPELDELYSYVTSRADREEMPRLIELGGWEFPVTHWVLSEFWPWFVPYDNLSKMLTKVIKVTECYRKVFQFVGKAVQSCSDGVGSLQDIYDEISSKTSIDESKCWDVSLFRRPTFDEIEQTVKKAATKFGFNKDCEQNNQQDEPGNVRDIVIDDYSDEVPAEEEKLSPTQRFMVCNLRSKSMSNGKINEMMEIRDVEKVKAVRCKSSRSRADSMYARDKQT